MATLDDYYREKGIRNPYAPNAVPEREFIDFPCSPLWQGYYHERGLTPFEGAEKRRSDYPIERSPVAIKADKPQRRPIPNPPPVRPPILEQRRQANPIALSEPQPRRIELE